MPVEAIPLFRPDALRARLRPFVLPDASVRWRATLRAWAELFGTPGGLTLKESELLPQFITDVFQDILGYTSPVSSAGRYTLSRERLVEVGGKFADAVLGDYTAESEHFVIAVEGKGPRDPLDRPFPGRKMSAVDQAYRYAINLPCNWIIVTNLREIRLYHKGSTQRTYERFEVAELAANERELRRFVFLLAAERVVPAGGESHLYRLLEASAKAGEAVTQAFYSQYARTRREALAAIRADNPDHPAEALLSATQKLLDRVLFVAFCEDRGLLPEGSLEAAYSHEDPYNPRPVWHNFLGLFRSIDRGNERLRIPAYNGGLFAEDPVLDHLEVRDDITRHFKRLGEYDYRSPSDAGRDEDEAGQLLDVEILGHVFEQSITDLEALEAELQGEVASSSAPVSRRKATGAYYTPEFVTRYIVERALGPAVRERFERLRRRHEGDAQGTAARALAEPGVYDLDALNGPQRSALVAFWEAWLRELHTIRVLDPACGSGAFLIEVFDQLYAEYQRAVEHLSELERGQARVFDPDRSILQHNIYGVDLNEEAIQIARLSVWIKTAQRGKALTDLNHNIRAGNSLVSDPAVDPRAFEWRTAFPEVFAQGGFDVVLGNPPYVRSETFSALKPYLRTRYAAYHGSADLYVYFYELGLDLLRPGGRLSYIVTNKWLRSGYGEPLRRHYADRATVEEVVDFGHAPIFPDADVFPCIIVVRKPAIGGVREDGRTTRVCAFPRESLGAVQVSRYVAEQGYDVPSARFGPEPWSLEHPGVEALLAKIRRAGTPLRDFAGVSPLYGIKTGYNEAFLIDTATRDRLVREDPAAAEIIRPYLRGQDIERWSPAWDGLWMIVMRSSENHSWPWAGKGESEAEQVLRAAFPSLHAHFKPFEPRLRKRTDQGAFWWELRSCGYYEAFERPKIFYPDIAWTPQWCLDDAGRVSNNTVYMLPAASPWLLAVLNSPVIWYYSWKNAVHGKDEALRMFTAFVEILPIAAPPPAARDATDGRVERLLGLTKERQAATQRYLDWLRVEFGVTTPGTRLSSLHELDPDGFIGEVRKRKAGGSTLSSAAVRRLREEYDATLPPLLEARRLASRLESEIADTVFAAYGLTAEEIGLMWSTAPPRMPIRGPSPSRGSPTGIEP